MERVDLKEQAPFNMKVSWLAALLIFILACLIMPEMKVSAYTPKVRKAIRTIELPQQMKQLEEPPPPPKPKMPVAAETEEEIEAATIEETDMTGFEKVPKKFEMEAYEFYAVDKPPEVIPSTQVSPKYPTIARKAGIEGTVYLELIVDTLGYVRSVKVLKGFNPDCEGEAVRAAKQWRFSPGMQRDRPVPVRVSIPIHFKLKED